MQSFMGLEAMWRVPICLIDSQYISNGTLDSVRYDGLRVLRTKTY
jgi:hypothetical protein